MFGNLGEMAKLMQKAKDIKANMAKMKEEMANSEFTSAAPGGAVSATVSGDFIVKRITIAAGAPSDRELLADLVTAAVNAATTNAKLAAQNKMTEITGGLDIPGLF